MVKIQEKKVTSYTSTKWSKAKMSKRNFLQTKNRPRRKSEKDQKQATISLVTQLQWNQPK